MRRRGRWIALALLVMWGCGGDPESGPGPVVWDRDVCERCQMVLSDRSFATQVRTSDGRLHHFDDVGCAVLWMHEHVDGEAREIWVRDVDASQWLDARQSRFAKVRNSPMGYGYGARPASAGEGVDLGALIPNILAEEDERRSPDR